jgi:HD-GYP domain-containing protein (c-di-GMP phosphodiesterase class II)
VSDDPPAADELVRLDTIGTVRKQGQDAPVRLFVAGLSEAGCDRLREGGRHEVTGDVEDLEHVDVIVISTRLPRADLRPLLTRVTAASNLPVVALAHTGGEGMAVEIMRAGGIAVVAEGNEAAIPAVLEGRTFDQSMIETFDRQVAQAAAFDPMRGRDRVTGLPGAGAFEQRVDDLLATGDVPRVMMLRVLGLASRDSRLSPESIALLRRRLTMSFRQLAGADGAELYSLGEAELGVVSADLSPNRAERLARQMADVTEMYAPLGSRVLSLAAGHAGPEASVELAPLTDIAKRALEVAAAEKRSNVVGADKLALGVSSTTELEAVQQAVAFVEQHGHCPEGHAQRVAEWSAEIAWQLGIEGQARTRVQLAALAHDAGRVGLPRACQGDPAELEGELLVAYRTHPVRGADWLRASAGNEVANAIRAHHEHWDGSGYPDGLVGEDIPLAARIIRVADTFDALLAGTDREVAQPLPAGEALTTLEARAGIELDPNVVEVALPILDKLLSARDG